MNGLPREWSVRMSEPESESELVVGKKTLIVFSGELDRAIAAFIIANGAAAMGDQVTMFFTFWGLTILRKPQKVRAKKSLLQSMFGMMLPRGPGKLGLSRMNFCGLGAVLMKRVMRQQNVVTLQELIATAREQGVTMIACTMSMDVMGFAPEELVDGVDFAGVATYLAEADEANVNLFI